MPTTTIERLIAIVGRPNVGKSTLFNRIIRQRKSLVHDEPGVTRDRIFGKGEHEGQRFFVCDTGGFEPASHDNIKKQLVEQAELAIEEASSIVFVVDGREGLHPIDQELVKRLRKAGKSFIVAVNKCDIPRDDLLTEDFRKLGIEKTFPVSAEHGRGIGDLLDAAVAALPLKGQVEEDNKDTLKLAIIGRPNVGKSSLLNKILGEERSIVDPRPGTTRDTVDALARYHGREVKILDTAGIRRKSRMEDKMERFSAFRSVATLEDSDVAALVIDAEEGPTEGDARVAGYAFELRKPMLIVVNKWDLIANKDSNTTKKYAEEVHRALKYIAYAPILFVSALENQRVSKLLPTCLELFDESNRRITTAKINNLLKEVLVKHTPPLTKNRSRRIKFYYSTQVGSRPPRFIIFCSDPEDIHFSYKRFIENEYREAFGFHHVPISLVFRERKRNPLINLPDGRTVRKTGGRTLSKHDATPDIHDLVFDENDEPMIEFADDEFDS